MMRRLTFLTASVFLLLLASTTPLQADLIVDIGSLNLAPGGTGSLDVTISGLTGAESLDIFGAEFRITTTGNSQLEFVIANPPTGARAPQLLNAGYVFPLDNSTSALIGAPSGNISTVSTHNDTYIGGDGTLLGNGATVPTSEELPVTLDVTANTPSAPVAGDKFAISLVDSANTFFWDPSQTNISYSSTVGTVTITPEPSIAVMLFGLVGMVGLITHKRLRRNEAA
jgi:hypothetical protein